MKMCRKFPVTLEQYIANHIQRYGSNCAEARYEKAKYVYSCMKSDRNAVWSDEVFGKLNRPEDAFEVWWDL